MPALYIFIGLVIGLIAGFFITRYIFNKQLKEHPPISESQIRAMFASMGQKPSEARVQAVLKSMGIQSGKTNQKKSPKEKK